MSLRARSGIVWGLCLLSCAIAHGQARKPPESGYVYPPVVAAGQVTEVTLGGYDWTDDLEWFVHQPGVALEVTSVPGDYFLTPRPYWIGPRASYPPAPIPREVAARIKVDANVAEGPVRWQVANANGASAPALVWITHRPEIERVELRSRELPQRLPPPPVAVSGRLSRLTEVDRYEFVAERDGLVIAELWARRLGSDFQGQLEVRDEAGRLLADFADTEGTDGLVAFAASAGRTYTIGVQDVDFRGDRAYVYRLALTPGPKVLATLPATGVRGATVDTEFIGWGVSTGAARLESRREPVTFPSDGNLATHTHSLAGSTAVSIPVGDRAETPLSSLTPAADGVLALPGDIVLAGHWPQDRPELRFAWTVGDKETWSVALESAAIGGTLDLRLSILDAEGKPVAEVDDLPVGSDAAHEFTSAKGGRFTIVARSLTAPSGVPTEIVRLALRKRAPDFALSHPQRVAVPLGGKAGLKIDAIRSGGFTGPIALTATGLPRGVTPTGTWEIPEGQTSATVQLEAASDADVSASIVRVVGSATVDGQPTNRPVRALAVGNPARRGADPHLEELLVAVTMEPPFEVKVVDRERQREVHRGTTYPAELEIVRKDGFAGPLLIAMTARQDRDRQGIRGPLFPVPDGAGTVFYPVTMPEWLSTDLTRRIVVHGVAKVPDPRGRLREVTAAADARITMILEGALLKLACDAVEPTVAPGGTLDLPVRVSRSPKLPLETTVELVVPEELAGLVEAEPLRLPPGRDNGTLVIRTKSDPRLAGEWSWELRATSLENDRLPVISVTDVNVLVRD
jgi:hypothetical protein